MARAYPAVMITAVFSSNLIPSVARRWRLGRITKMDDYYYLEMGARNLFIPTTRFWGTRFRTHHGSDVKLTIEIFGRLLSYLVVGYSS